MMKRFMLKCTFIALVLFLGVLVGMQQANEGMKKMQGVEGATSSGQPFQIFEKEDGEKRTLLGAEGTKQDIEAKQQKLEQIKSHNFYSSMGKKLADGVSNAVGKVIQDSVEKVKEL